MSRLCTMMDRTENKTAARMSFRAERIVSHVLDEARRDCRRAEVTEYEEEVQKARRIALDEMLSQATDRGANAIVGVDIDYEVIRLEKTS